MKILIHFFYAALSLVFTSNMVMVIVISAVMLCNSYNYVFLIAHEMLARYNHNNAKGWIVFRPVKI